MSLVVWPRQRIKIVIVSSSNDELPLDGASQRNIFVNAVLVLGRHICGHHIDKVDGPVLMFCCNGGIPYQPTNFYRLDAQGDISKNRNPRSKKNLHNGGISRESYTRL